MKLIGSHASPYVRKVRVVLAEKSLEFEFAMGDVMAVPSPVFEDNPLGKIPCLVLDDGQRLYDSRVIVEYLDTLSSGCQLIPGNARERAAIRCWEALADGALDAGILVRWEAVQRQPQYQDPSWTARQREKIDHALHAMSEQLADKLFCAGETFTLADAAVGATLGWFLFRFPEMDWPTRYPNLAALQQRLAERHSFSATIPRV